MKRELAEAQRQAAAVVAAAPLPVSPSKAGLVIGGEAAGKDNPKAPLGESAVGGLEVAAAAVAAVNVQGGPGGLTIEEGPNLDAVRIEELKAEQQVAAASKKKVNTYCKALGVRTVQTR